MSRVLRLWGCMLAAAATTVASACESDTFLTGSLSGAVVTVVDSGPPLASARTFVLPDTIVELPAGASTLDHVADREIIASIRAHLLSLGWRDAAADPSLLPDIVVLVAASTRIQTGVFYTDWYGAWGYLPYWSPAVSSTWAWSEPVGAIPYAFPAGTLLMTMLDLRAQREETRDISLLWAGVVDGVVRGRSAAASAALDGIDQAFAQSPYLLREGTDP